MREPPPPGSWSSRGLPFGIAYAELRRLARAVRGSHTGTLSTTELLHEAWSKLQPMSRADVADQTHFKRLIARAMRQVLIDGARRRAVRVRHHRECAVGGTAPLDGEDRLAVTLIDLDEALGELAALDGRRAAVVECRFFGDMDVEETATALGISVATVKRDWRLARAWLAQALDGA